MFTLRGGMYSDLRSLARDVAHWQRFDVWLAIELDDTLKFSEQAETRREEVEIDRTFIAEGYFVFYYSWS